MTNRDIVFMMVGSLVGGVFGPIISKLLFGV